MSTRSGRRGAVVIVLVVVLAMIGLMTVGALSASGMDAQVGVYRLESVRALYAAESGVVAVARLSNEGLTMPSENAEVNLGHATTVFVTCPPAGQPGDVTVEGRSGECRRSISVVLMDG